MNVRWTHSRRTHLWVALLLLPALACRMLVPPGFMPGTDANHVPTMQMCHGAGPLPQGAQSPAEGRRTAAWQSRASRIALRLCGRRHGCATADHVADSRTVLRRLTPFRRRRNPPLSFGPSIAPILTKGASRHRQPCLGLDCPF